MTAIALAIEELQRQGFHDRILDEARQNWAANREFYLDKSFRISSVARERIASANKAVRSMLVN